MFDKKSLQRLIIPLIIDQLLAVTIGIADTVMVASCGQAAVSGISLVDSINFLLINLFSSLATGGAVIAAQYIGKNDSDTACKSANQLFYSSLFLSLLIMAVTLIFRDAALTLIFGNIEADVMENARIYFLLSALSYPFLSIFNSGAALFRSMGDSKTSMLTSVFMNTLNVIGNAVLIFIAGWGVFGAALSTLISRIIGAVIITLLLLNKERILHYKELYKVRLNFSLIKKILYIGVPNGVENSIFQIGKILVSSILAGFGTAAITANAVAGNLASIQIIPASAIGMAMITVVGQCIGAKDYDAAKKYAKKLTFLAYIAIWAMTAFLVVFIYPILGFYGLPDETVALTVQVFIVHGICAVFIWAPAFALPNALRAANDVKYTMYVSLFSMWIFRIGFSYILAVFFNMGVMGIWVAMCIDWLVRSVFFMVRFIKGKWTKKTLV